MSSEERFCGPVSLLDIWHGSGAPHRRLTLGQRAGSPGEDTEAGIDLAILAPSPEELSRVWLEQAVSRTADRLAEDGLVWIIVPRPWRARAEKLLAANDLTVVETVLASPPWPGTTYLLPVTRFTLRGSLARLIGRGGGAEHVLARLLSSRAALRMVRRLAPSCLLLATRAYSSDSVLSWLDEIDGAGARAVTATLGLRRDAVVATARRFSGAARPDLIVKVGLDERGAERVVREREALRRLGKGAMAAGAAVPVARSSRHGWMLATEALVGEPMDAVLVHSPNRLGELMHKVARWLGAWNVATSREVGDSTGFLAQQLLAPADRLRAAGVAPHRYVGALEELVERLGAGPLMTVAVHNDLTAANVLESQPDPAILDWESAADTGLPLADLWYLLIDAVARARRIEHHHALELWVTGVGELDPALSALPLRQASLIGLDANQALAAFHGCWIRHADNELSRGITDGPFTRVLQTVAMKHLHWPGCHRG